MGKRSRWLILGSLLLIWCMGILDLQLTLRGLELGLIEEANPILRSVLNYPSLVWPYKATLTTFYSAVVLYAAWLRHPWTGPCIGIGLATNGAVLLLHLRWLLA